MTAEAVLSAIKSGEEFEMDDNGLPRDVKVCTVAPNYVTVRGLIPDILAAVLIENIRIKQ